MVTRKKSRLERFFSLNQHRKRLGASQALSPLEEIDLSTLKANIISIDEVTYTHGADKNLSEHLHKLKAEFANQSELVYYHAKLIVLLRREYKPKTHYAAFTALWDAEKDYLLKHLNTRWLVAAADTIADHSENQTEQALSLSVALLINTIKLQETERFIKSSTPQQDSDAAIQTLQSQRVALFDGTSAFAIGTDDTLRNMRWRMDRICNTEWVAGSILQEVFQRLQNENTVYQRFKLKHTRKKTAWW